MKDLIDVVRKMKKAKRLGRPSQDATNAPAEQANETNATPVPTAVKARTRYDPESRTPTDPEVLRKYHAARRTLREYWEDMEGNPVKGRPLHGISSLKGKDKRDSDSE